MVSGKKRKEAEPATASGTKLGRRNQLANWASGSSLDGRGGGGGGGGGGGFDRTHRPPPQPTGLSFLLWDILNTVVVSWYQTPLVSGDVQGTISFLLKTWGRCPSDKFITEHSLLVIQIYSHHVA